jgi:uncharacterized protein
MAKLARILLYPIKSLDPMEVSEARLGPAGGLVGDRQYALIDEAGDVVTGKRDPAVHGIRCTFDLGGVRVCMWHHGSSDRQSFDLEGERAAAQAWLSAQFGKPVQLARRVDGGFPDDLDSPGPTLVSTGSLAQVSSWFPGIEVGPMRRRIRANLEIDGVPAFWEDRLVAGLSGPVRFRVGEATLLGTTACQRCAVPGRDPDTGTVWPGFQKMFVERRGQALPPWAPRSAFGHFFRLAVNTQLGPGSAGTVLRVGDPVELAL